MAYINRELMFDKIKEKAMTKFDWSEQIDIDDFEKVIKELPVADVEEVKYGKWIEIPFKPKHDYDTLKGYSSYKCSLCGRKEKSKEPYCHCGAKMNRDMTNE